MSQEMERKFLLARFPHEELASSKCVIVCNRTIEQTYLVYTEEEQIRVRKLIEWQDGLAVESYFHTFKRGIGLVREEIEYPISAEIYHQLLAMNPRKPLCKERTTISFEGQLFEIDSYLQFDLQVIEVEFQEAEQMERFKAPDWFGKEISFDKSLTNKSLWKRLQT